MDCLLNLIYFFLIRIVLSMPFSKLFKPRNDLKFKFQFCSPTQDISQTTDILQYVNSKVAYTLIPSMQNSLIYNPINKVIQIIPYTEKSIVDICLPYIDKSKKNVVRHFARYIICNKQLVGIKIKPTQSWPRSKVQRIPVPDILKEYYIEQGIKDFQPQILVGQFLIATKNFKIAPLFLSQITLLTDNAIRNLYSQYYNLGCQIFSILNDIPEERKKLLRKPLQVLKTYRKQSIAIIYYGMHMATGLNEYINTEAFACQDSDNFKKITVQNLNEVYKEEIIFDVTKMKRKRKLNQLQDSSVNNEVSSIEVLECARFWIKSCPEKIQQNHQEFNNRMQLQQQSQKQRKKRILKLYLWYLYANLNRKNPFTLPFPLANKDEQLYKQLKQLSQAANLPLAQLVLFIKLDTKLKVNNKKYQNQGIKIIPIQKISRQRQTFYLYFNLKDRFSNLVFDKQNNYLQELKGKAVECTNWITEDVQKLISSEADTQSNAHQSQLQSENQKLIQRFLKKKPSTLSLQQFYYEFARYYPRSKLTEQFLEEMFLLMKTKIREKVQVSTFQLFVINTEYDEIKNVFRQAQQTFYCNPNYNLNVSKLKAQQDHPGVNKQQQKKQTGGFRAFIDKVKYHVTNQKKANNPCHICKALFHKKQKSDYGRNCLRCNNFICFACIDTKCGGIAQTLQNYQICLVCDKRCDCQSCNKKNNNINTSKGYIKDDYSIQNIAPKRVSMKILPEQQNVLSRSLLQSIKKQQYSQKAKPQFQQYHQQQTNFQLVKSCLQCAFNNRLQRIISFECSACKDIKCLQCQKASNFKRSWVLRGQIRCNECYEKFQENIKLKAQNKIVKDKLALVEQELTQLKRQKTMSQYYLPPINQPIIQEQNQYHEDFSQEEMSGGATPIFDRSQSKKNQGQSPVRASQHNMPSQRESLASFAGNQKNQNKKMRKNSSASSGSIKNVPTYQKKSQKEKNSKRKRSNSSEKSQKASIASFNKKTAVNDQNSSVSSKRSQKPAKNNNNRQRNSSAQSGQFEGSSTSSKADKKQQKKNWNTNSNFKESFNNRNDTSSYNIGKGMEPNYDGRNRNNNRNNEQHKSFNNKGGDNRGYQNNKNNTFQKKNQSRGFNDNRGGNKPYEKKQWEPRDSNKKWQNQKNNQRQNYNPRDKKQNNHRDKKTQGQTQKYHNNNKEDNQFDKRSNSSKRSDNDNKGYIFSQPMKKNSAGNDDIEY